MKTSELGVFEGYAVLSDSAYASRLFVLFFTYESCSVCHQTILYMASRSCYSLSFLSSSRFLFFTDSVTVSGLALALTKEGLR
jgi:hypothetical protein